MHYLCELVENYVFETLYIRVYCNGIFGVLLDDKVCP